MMRMLEDISEYIVNSVNFKDFTADRLNHGLPLIILFGIVLGLWIFFTRGVFNKVKEPWWTKFPGPRPLPIIGNAFYFAVPDYEIMGALKSLMEYGDDVVLAWLGSQPYIFLKGPDAIEKVLSSNTHIEKSIEYHYFTTWLGTGLLTSKGTKWHGRRKLLTPAFHFKILDHFIEIFNEQTQVLVECLDEKAISGKTFNIYPYVTRCALDIICETAMGEKIHAQRNSETEYVKAVYEITELLLKRITWPMLRLDFLWLLFNYRKREKQLLSILHGFTGRVIQSRKAERELDGNVLSDDPDSNPFGKRRRAFLDLLLDASDNGRLMSDLDIREEADTFMFEGHDTTAASMNFTIFLLACNPECQKKVHAELEDIFSEDWDRFITTADLSRMKYLECCIKESLRMFPSVPFIGRQIIKDLDLGNERIVPKDTVIWITTNLLHRDPRIYPEPDRFLPERFAPENSDEVRKHPFAYIPFSAGPRNCIGQKFAQLEEKLALAQFFRNFRVEPREKLEDLKLVPELILRPKNGLLVSISKLRQ